MNSLAVFERRTTYVWTPRIHTTYIAECKLVFYIISRAISAWDRYITILGCNMSIWIQSLLIFIRTIYVFIYIHVSNVRPWTSHYDMRSSRYKNWSYTTLLCIRVGSHVYLLTSFVIKWHMYILYVYVCILYIAVWYVHCSIGTHRSLYTTKNRCNQVS